MIPIRTCAGCGDRAPQPRMQRFVAGSQGLALDGGSRAAGRGAYLHPVPGCWAQFVRRRGPVRSLRVAADRATREALVAALASRVGA